MTNCEKEENLAEEQTVDHSSIIDHERYPGINVENDVLCFESIEYYESIAENEEGNSTTVDELSKYVATVSFKSYGKSVEVPAEFSDPFIDAILNEDQVVKIGEWFIQIDIQSEQVWALSSTEENAYQNLIAHTGRNLREFSIGDDVLEHLANNTTPEDRACGGIGGGTYSAYPNIADAPVIGSIGGTEITLNTGVKFFRAGIYFRLSSLYELWPSVAVPSSVFAIKVEVKAPQGWYKKKPCNGSSVGTQAAYTAVMWSMGTSGQATFYSGTRNLNGYYYYVRAKCTNCGTDWTSYGGRNINSPY